MPSNPIQSSTITVTITPDESVKKYLASKDSDNELRDLLAFLRDGKNWNVKLTLKSVKNKDKTVTWSVEKIEQVVFPAQGGSHVQGNADTWKYQIDKKLLGAGSKDRLFLTITGKNFRDVVYDLTKNKVTANISIQCSAKVAVDTH